MADFEEKHMENLRKIGLKVWYRYVDDVFATINGKNNAEKILEYLNNQHPNIRFTVEHEENNTLPFLDTRILRQTEKYETTLYHKKPLLGSTLTGLVLQLENTKLVS